MAGLDPAIQSQNQKRWSLLPWIAASEGGHDHKATASRRSALARLIHSPPITFVLVYCATTPSTQRLL